MIVIHQAAIRNIRLKSFLIAGTAENVAHFVEVIFNPALFDNERFL